MSLEGSAEPVQERDWEARAGRRRWTTGRRFAAVTAIVVLVGAGVVVAADTTGSFGLGRGRGAAATPTTPTGANSTDAAPNASAEPSAQPEDAWSDLELASLKPVATLVASNADRAGIASTSMFTLTSLTRVDATTLARGLTTIPPVPFSVKAGSDPTTAVIVPKAPLPPATSYRFTLRTPDAALGGSWLFRTESPLHVESTLPGNEATKVPTNTGIEIQFDQDGVGPIGKFFSIEPKVGGRLEQHGRTWAFVPAAPLAPATIYTVTVRHGVALSGSDQVLGDDVTFSFETLARGESPDDGSLPPLDASFPRLMTEVVPSERPVVEVYAERTWNATDSRKPLTKLDVRVFRLPGLPAALAAYKTLGAAPMWARTSDQRLVPTGGLPLVASFTASIHTISRGDYEEGISYVEFPAVLEGGWYLVVRPRAGARDQQVILQVTDVAAYVTTTTTRSILWVNDVTTGRPIEGATLWTAGGRSIAKTGTDGTATPSIPPGTVFAVTAPDGGGFGAGTTPGRAILVPLTVEAAGGRGCWFDWSSDSERYWLVLGTDRMRFRPSDEIDAWGMLRPRDGGTAQDVELRLSVDRWQCDETAAENRALAIAHAAVTPGGSTGTFGTPLSIRDVPAGWYRLELWAGDERVASRGIEIGDISKPSYTFSVATDHHVLVDGDTFAATVTSQFFDGTRLPALDVRMSGPDVGDRRATTSADGETSLALTASWSEATREAWSTRAVTTAPVMPEEAEIPSQSSGYVVFPSSVLLDGKAVIDGANVRITGDAHMLDQAGAEREWVASAGSTWEPKGAVAPGTKVSVRVVDRWVVPVKVGRGYDFISKRGYDMYRYDDQERVLAQTTVVAGHDGAFSLTVARGPVGDASPKGHDYQVTLSAVDGARRAVSATRFAYAAWMELADRSAVGPPWAELGFAQQPQDVRYAAGDRIQRVLSWRGAQPPTGGANRYLFFVASRGLRDVTVSDSPAFLHTFAASDIPNVSIGAVWFTGSHYVVANGTWASFDSSTRRLQVTLAPDAGRHAPGDSVRLSVTTATADGRPVPSTLVLRAIDEKLYAIGAAGPEDPLEQTYQWVNPGVEQTYASHPVPGGRPMNGGGGDTTGGGGGPGGGARVRSEFRDAVLFQRITTGPDGRGSVTFRLSDDITSWRVTGTAFTADLRTGQSSTSIVAGLPFFVEAPLADEYLTADRPTLLVRAYGTALATGQAVSFTVSAPTLGMPRTTVSGPAFTHVAIPLPALTPGEHRITIEASSGAATATVRDALARTIRVVDSRFTQRRSASVVLPAALPAAGGTGIATYVFADAGRGKYLDALERLVASGGDRVDQALATSIARDVLTASFGIDEGDSATPASLYAFQKPATTANGGDYGAGIALLPYGSPDVALSARVSLLGSSHFDTQRLATYFDWLQTSETSTSEQKNLALAGMAGIEGREDLAADVAEALHAPDLTVREQLYLALAAATLGDHATALSVERSLLAAYGQRLGPWVRLRVTGSPDDALEATSLLALIAITVGDPVADAAEAYVEEHGSKEDVYDLQEAAFLRAAIDRTPAPAARFSYTIAGDTQVVDLRPGGTSILRLTPTQRAALAATTLSGRIGVTVSWDEPIDASSIAADPSLSIVRTVSPASPVPAGSIVKIVLTPRLGELTIGGCYRVVDLVPSGLRPMGWTYDATADSEDVTPWVISGQKVVFCTWSGYGRPPRLVYYARVVTPGDYTWEPAIIQPERATESAALTPSLRITLE